MLAGATHCPPWKHGSPHELSRPIVLDSGKQQQFVVFTSTQQEREAGLSAKIGSMAMSEEGPLPPHVVRNTVNPRASQTLRGGSSPGSSVRPPRGPLARTPPPPPSAAPSTTGTAHGWVACLVL